MTVIVKGGHFLGNYNMHCVCRKWMKLIRECASGQISNNAALREALKGDSLQ